MSPFPAALPVDSVPRVEGETSMPDLEPESPSTGWGGRTGCIGYLAKMFPRISETFILEEIQALRRHGVPVRIYSLLEPNRDARVHPEAEGLASECFVLPEARWSHMPHFLADLWACFRVRPSGTAKQVFRLFREPGRRSFRRLVRATALAARMRRDHVAHLHAAWAHGPASVAR